MSSGFAVGRFFFFLLPVLVGVIVVPFLGLLTDDLRGDDGRLSDASKSVGRVPFRGDLEELVREEVRRGDSEGGNAKITSLEDGDFFFFLSGLSLGAGKVRSSVSGAGRASTCSLSASISFKSTPSGLAHISASNFRIE